MDQLFQSLLSWLTSFVLFVPFQILKLVGLLLPDCDTFGITTFSVDAMQSAVNILKFLNPITQYVPWGFVWNFLSAVILYRFFKWMFQHLPRLMQLALSFWWVIVIFYVLAGFISFFTSTTWYESSVFQTVFGAAPGAVGGGGGSW